MPHAEKLRTVNNVLHRDLGYFFATLIIAYSISGIALNHIDDWNPDFLISKKKISLGRSYHREEITPRTITTFSELAGEERYRLYDFPSSRQVKIYYKNATLQIDLERGSGTYEKISRRPLFYQVNILHRNSVEWWKWISDIFAAMLIVITVTGMFMLRGKKGITGRGKWLLAFGMIPPLIALIVQQL